MAYRGSVRGRRDLLKLCGLGLGFFKLTGCVTRRSQASALRAADFSPPRKPLRSPDGFPVRYHMRQSLTQDIANLLAVYSHVYQVMLSGVPASQAAALQIDSTPGKLRRFLPEAAQENWESFTWWGQAEIHFNNCPHGSESFVLWHRAFIFYFEQIARTLAQAIVADAESGRPDAEKLKTHRDYYTDWTIPIFHWNPQETLPAIFFDTEAFPPYPDNPDIGLGNTRAVLPSSKQNPVDSPWASFIDVSEQTLQSILAVQDIVSFSGGENFTSLLEAAPHNGIHTWIGGQMNAFFSPLDPLFYCHHAMVDYLFEEWLIRRRNEGMESADFLPGVLARDEQTGFMDVHTGQPASLANRLLIDSNRHAVAYDEATRRVHFPAPSPGPLALEEAPSDARLTRTVSPEVAAARVERVIVDDFRGRFYALEEESALPTAPTNRETEANVILLRAELRVKENRAIVERAAVLLEKITADLRNPDQAAKKYISSVQLRFENIALAVEDRFTTTLQITIRKKGFKPFVESNFAIFRRFGAKPNSALVQSVEERMRKKETTGGRDHHHHGHATESHPGLVVDLVPVLRDQTLESFDFRELLSSDSFWVEFRLAQRETFGIRERPRFSVKLARLVNEKMKISLVVQARMRSSVS